MQTERTDRGPATRFRVHAEAWDWGRASMCPPGRRAAGPLPASTAAEPHQQAHGAKGLCTASSVTRTQGIRMSIFNSPHPGRKTNPSHTLQIPIRGAGRAFWELSPPGSRASFDGFASARKGSEGPAPAGASLHYVWLGPHCPRQGAISWWTPVVTYSPASDSQAGSPAMLKRVIHSLTDSSTPTFPPVPLGSRGLALASPGGVYPEAPGLGLRLRAEAGLEAGKPIRWAGVGCLVTKAP